MEQAHHCQACECPACGAEGQATCMIEPGHVVRWCEICYRVHRIDAPRCLAGAQSRDSSTPRN